MAQVQNNQSRFGGEYLIQDSDHMSGISERSNAAQVGAVRQSDQSQTGSRQQGGGDQHAGSQQGGERKRKLL
jgi:hypothetical protein